MNGVYELELEENENIIIRAKQDCYIRFAETIWIGVTMHSMICDDVFQND